MLFLTSLTLTSCATLKHSSYFKGQAKRNVASAYSNSDSIKDYQHVGMYKKNSESISLVKLGVNLTYKSCEHPIFEENRAYCRFSIPMSNVLDLFYPGKHLGDEGVKKFKANGDIVASYKISPHVDGNHIILLVDMKNVSDKEAIYEAFRAIGNIKFFCFDL